MGFFDSIGDALVKAGGQAASNLADKAVYGNTEGAKISMARERDYYAGLNGSGPTDRAGALTDAKKGDTKWWDPFDRGGALGSGMNPLLIGAAVGLGILLFILVLRRR